MKNNLAVKVTAKDIDKGFQKAKEMICYDNLISQYRLQIKDYEDRLSKNKIPDGQMKWTETLLDNLRGALSCAEKNYELLRNTQPEKLGGNK